jgi:predicted glycosyltransferase
MRSIRIVSYVVNGSGVGHLARQVAIQRWVRRLAAVRGVRAEIYFLTSSEADATLFNERFASFKLPSKTTIADAEIDKTTYLALAKQWVWHSIGLIRPDLLVVDTFPRGSFGELLTALDLCKRRAFVFRPTKGTFASRADFQAMLPLYDAILVPEHEEDASVVVPEAARSKLHHTGPICARDEADAMARDEARARLGAGERRVVYVSAGGGGDPGAEAFIHRVCDTLARDPNVLVAVGAGPLYRGRRVLRDGVVWLAADEPSSLVRAFDVAVCACGYNTYVELMHAGVPAVFCPQDKIADDQLERATRASRAGAAVVVEGAFEASSDAIRDAVTKLLEPDANRRAREAARSLVPTTHARDAAAELLRLVMPAYEVEAAEAILDDRAIARDIPPSAIFLVASALEPRLRDVPGAISAVDAARLALDVLEQAASLAIPHAVVPRICDAVTRVFIEAPPAARAVVCLRLLPALAPFADWEAAVLFLRSFHTERALTPAAFADALAAALAELRRRGATLLESTIATSRVRSTDVATNDAALRALAERPS